MAARGPPSPDDADEAAEGLHTKRGNASIEARALPFYTTDFDLQLDADQSLAIFSQQPNVVNGQRTGPREPLSNLDKYAYNVKQGAGTTVYIIDATVVLSQSFKTASLRAVGPNLRLVQYIADVKLGISQYRLVPHYISETVGRPLGPKSCNRGRKQDSIKELRVLQDGQHRNVRITQNIWFSRPKEVACISRCVTENSQGHQEEQPPRQSLYQLLWGF